MNGKSRPEAAPTDPTPIKSVSSVNAEAVESVTDARVDRELVEACDWLWDACDGAEEAGAHALYAAALTLTQIRDELRAMNRGGRHE